MNKPITAVAVDDEPLALELVKHYCSSVRDLQLIASFTDALAAENYLNKTMPDLLIMDVQMPDINGIALLNRLPRLPYIIFATAHRQFAYEGFELNAVDYLLKPYSLERFAQAIEKVKARLNAHQPGAQEEAYWYVKVEYAVKAIRIADVVYLEGVEDYVRIHLTEGRPILTLLSLKSSLEKLATHGFARIHRSYVVNRRQVDSMRGRKVYLKNGTELPVGETYLNDVRALME